MLESEYEVFVRADGGRDRGVVVFDDDFTDGPNLHGWEQLYSGGYQAPIGWDRGAMVLTIDNGVTQSSTAIKRGTYFDRYTKIKLEIWCGLSQVYGDNKIRAVQFGVDQADNAGARSYYRMRNLFTETDGTAPSVNRWELATGTDSVPSNTPIPGQGYPATPIASGDPIPTYTAGNVTQAWSNWPPNENKRNRVYVALEMDIANGRYLGAQFNDTKVGSLSPVPSQNPISSYSGQTSTLTRFANGLNASIDLVGLLTGSKTMATLSVFRARLTGRM